METKTQVMDKDNQMQIGGVAITNLTAKYGTPLFVFDQKYIEDISLTYKNSLEKYYGDGLILYASKAFSAKGIYRLIGSLGLGCDVVSGGELYTALSAGFDANKIYFHGNNKTYSELKYAIENKISTIVVDSLQEADDIENIATELNCVQDVLIRVNPGVEAHTHHYVQTANISSKFGFSTSNGDAEKAILYVNKLKHLNLKGLHCHIGSQIFEIKSFLIATDKMLAFYNELKNNYSIEFSTLNLGGGFGIKYTENDPDLTFRDYENFIKEISSRVKEKVNEYKLKKPFLIFEPGRSIVASAGTTLYTVGNVKEIKDVKNYLAIDGGMFENPRFALYQSKYTVVAPEKINQRPTKKYTIAGKCCESGDIIAEDILLPEMMKGDLLAVLATGAYNYSMASNYNRNLIPPVVIVKDGVSNYLVKPQTYEDLIRNDV